MAKEVTVYTMNRCPFCLQLKLFLKRQGVEFIKNAAGRNQFLNSATGICG